MSASTTRDGPSATTSNNNANTSIGANVNSSSLSPVEAIDKVDLVQLEAAVGDDASINDEKEVEDKSKVDYSGFAQKTDPKEIKLVRKLDMYIMVSRWWISDMLHGCV